LSLKVEACERDSVAVRTAAAYGKWQIILGTWDWHNRPHQGNRARSIILGPGAKGKVFEVHAPIGIFAPVDDLCGNDSNLILSSDWPPMAQAAKPTARTEKGGSAPGRSN